MLEALSFTFIQNALLAAFLVSIAVGAIGTLVVSNKTVFIAGGIAHASYGGIGLALFFALPFFLTTTLFSIVTAIIIGFFSIKYPHRIDSFIGVIWAFGMAVGIIFTDLTPGYNVDLISYLFGSILSVPKEDLIFIALLDLGIVGIISCFYPALLAISFDKEYAKAKGVKTTFFTILLYILTAITIVISIRAVGLILILALLTIPVYIGESFSNSLGKTMIASGVISFAISLCGLALSYYFNLTSGASIILVATFLFLIFFIIRHYLD